MKIFHLVQNYYPSIGGIQALMQQFSEGLVELYGDEVSVFTTNTIQSPHSASLDYISPKSETVNGVDVRRFHYYQHFTLFHKFMNRTSQRLFHRHLPENDYLFLLKTGPLSPQMFFSVMGYKADIVAGASAPYLHMTYPLLARKFGQMAPFVYIGALHLQNLHIRELVLQSIRASDACIALTSFEKQFLVSKGIMPEKIRVISPGIQMKQFEQADGQRIRQNYNIGDAPVVAFIGRQASYKGIDTLLDAMQIVWQSRPETIAIIAGARGDYTSQIEQTLCRLPPSQRDHILHVSDITEQEKSDYYAASDIFVTISEGESFGIVYLEAWACLKPVIGCRIGAVASVIDEGENGLLVPNRNAEKLAEAITTLLKDEKLRRQFGEMGFQKVQENYTREISIARLRKVYEQIIH